MSRLFQTDGKSIFYHGNRQIAKYSQQKFKNLLKEICWHYICVGINIYRQCGSRIKYSSFYFCHCFDGILLWNSLCVCVVFVVCATIPQNERCVFAPSPMLSTDKFWCANVMLSHWWNFKYGSLFQYTMHIVLRCIVHTFNVTVYYTVRHFFQLFRFLSMHLPLKRFKINAKVLINF